MPKPISPPVQPVGCTSSKLRQLTRRVAQHYDSEVAATGLKTTQYALLNQVAARGPVRPVDLAQAIHMNTSTLSRNLQLLVQAGWLTMEAGPDARSRMLRITPAGDAKRLEARQYWRQAQRSLNALLGVERVAALHLLIDDSLGLLEDTPLDPDICG